MLGSFARTEFCTAWLRSQSPGDSSCADAVSPLGVAIARMATDGQQCGGQDGLVYEAVHFCSPVFDLGM